MGCKNSCMRRKVHSESEPADIDLSLNQNIPVQYRVKSQVVFCCGDVNEFILLKDTYIDVFAACFSLMFWLIFRPTL